MEAQKIQAETNQSAAATSPEVSSCRKKKRDDATFLEDVKDHIDEFIHASMAEHTDCFKKTMQKVVSLTLAVSVASALTCVKCSSSSYL